MATSPPKDIEESKCFQHILIFMSHLTYSDFISVNFMITEQGMDDWVVPPSITDYVQRVLPGAMVHKLLYEGHFTYFYFCDECHRQIFSTLFGNPQGPVIFEVDQIPLKKDIQEVE